jgi:hypothetical protein
MENGKGVTCIYYHRCIMIASLLSSQLAKRLVSELPSCLSVGIYLTQVVGQQNTYDMIQNLNKVGGSELVYIP